MSRIFQKKVALHAQRLYFLLSLMCCLVGVTATVTLLFNQHLALAILVVLALMSLYGFSLFIFNDLTNQIRLSKEALDTYSGAFALYDKNDILISYNNTYRDIHKNAFAQLKPPITYADLMWQSARTLDPDVDASDWVNQRVADQRAGTGDYADRRNPGGRWVRVSKKKTPSGAIAGYATDITELKEREMELSLSEKRYFALTKISTVGIWQLSANGETLFANPVLLRFFSEKPEQNVETLHPLSRVQLLRKHSVATHQETIDKLLTHEGLLQSEVLIRHDGKGEQYALLARSPKIISDDGQESSYMLTLTDVTEQKITERKIRYMAERDSLTGLHNRSYLYLHLQRLVDEEKNHPFTFILLDLDKFKHINDSLGHPAGDELLRIIAKRLNNIVYPQGIVCRLGGDEFAIILYDAKDEDLSIEDVMSVFHQPVNLEGRNHSVSGTAGFALYPKDASSVDELVKNADIALYHRKALGRGHWHPFDQHLARMIHKKLTLENDLRRALSDQSNEMMVFYQPLYHLKTGEIRGVEALARWKNARTNKWVLPSEFIAMAESTELIQKLDEVIILAATKQMGLWHRMGFNALLLSVNVSMVHFVKGRVKPLIDFVLRNSGIPRDCLEIEITETVLLDFNEDVVKVINHIRGQGIKISIDDFGTGYCSLGYLNKIPIDTLKIDKSFLCNYESSEYHQAIMHCIIQMAKILKVETVIEGIETSSQWQYMKNSQCDFGQGFYMAKPMSEEAVTELLFKQKCEYAS